MDNQKGVLVCGEIVEGKIAPITIELLESDENWQMTWVKN